MKLGDVDKSGATSRYNLLILIFLHHFIDMSKKFVFSVVAKSQKKMAFHAANNVTNAMFVVADFRQNIRLV